MKLQQFINVLDKSDEIAHTFFKKHGKNIFSNNYILFSLLKEKWNQKTLLKLFRLEEIIDFDLRREYNKEKTYFKNMLPLYRYFEHYMGHGCAFFGNRRLPFEEWEDLAKEQTDILKILIERNQLKSFKRTKIFHQFNAKCSQRVDLFEKKGYLHESDFDVPSGL